MNIAKRKELIIFLLILAVAVFFRLYKLDLFPPGLYPDEAMNGNNAIGALETGNFKVFYPENNGREGLFINLQALSLKIFGISPWSLRAVSAIIGILAVIGLYLLVKELFDWRLAALSSFLMAISFWHVNFSRIGFRAILLPLILVFGFYFLWRGVKNYRLLDFILAGVFGGLGFHTYISYRVAPLIIVLFIISYWRFLKRDLSFSNYNKAKIKLLRGILWLTAAAIIVALPIGLYFLQNPDSFSGRTGLSVFNQNEPLKQLLLSIVKTLGMFTFNGDYNWRHNISGAPMLPWPIGIFFAIGFIKEFIHWLKRKHGHFSPTHTFLFSWLFVMLLPGFLSVEAPHALRTIGALPVVMILSASGIWWSFEKIKNWHAVFYPSQRKTGIFSFLNLVLLIFIISLGFLEYSRYFKNWALHPHTASMFNQNYVKTGEIINSLPKDVKKYVLVNAGGVLVKGIPMPAQTVMFITDTYTVKKQIAKNVFYITEEQFMRGQFDRSGFIIPLEKR